MSPSTFVTLYTSAFRSYFRSGYNDDNIYAKVDDMTYYPVNNTLATSLPNTNSTTSTTREGGGIGTPSAGGFFPNQQQAR